MINKIIAFVFCLISVMAFSQKPEKGSYGATAGLSAVAGFPNTDASTTGSLLFKYYLMDGFALRGALNYRTLAGAGTTFIDTNKIIVSGTSLPSGDGFSTFRTDLKGSTFDVELGFQKDIAKLEKFEPYVGAAFVMGISGKRSQYSERNWIVDGMGRTAGDYDKTTSVFNLRNNTGGKVFMGANYYLLKNISVGAEFGYGYFFSTENGGNVKTESSIAGVVSTLEQTTGNYNKTTKGFRTTGAVLTVSFVF
jgi:hypothetical protein